MNSRSDIPLPASSLGLMPLLGRIFPYMLILVLGGACYANTLTVPFLFDDIGYLVENPAIRSFDFFRDHGLLAPLPVEQDIKNNFLLRPVAYLSFALNYRLNGLEPEGYHLVNLAIHLANGLVLYRLLTLILRTPFMTRSARGDDRLLRLLPIGAALLFVAHPLQTQAVTYIVQRFTSLATFFYLTGMLLYVQARLSVRPIGRWCGYCLALIATVLAMKTKEIAFTLPLVIAVGEWLFFPGTLRERFPRIAPFLASMAIIPVTVIGLAARANPGGRALTDSLNLVNFENTSRWDYVRTQFGVIATYLRLLLLPVGQNADPDYPLATSFLQPAVLLPLGLLLSLLVLALLLCRWSRDTGRPESGAERLAAFGILWFFLALAVESSIVPLDDPMFEYRVYLPSVGFFLASLAMVALLGARLARHHHVPLRTITCGGCIVVAVLALATVRRNVVWQDAVSFWEDAAVKNPAKARPQINLGSALLDAGRADEAVTVLSAAVRLAPRDASVHNNLGLALSARRDFAAAARQYVIALAYLPRNPKILSNLAIIQIEQGQFAQARTNIEEMLRMDASQGYAALGYLLEKEGRIDEAIDMYRKVLAAHPGNEWTEARLDELTAPVGPIRTQVPSLPGNVMVLGT